MLHPPATLHYTHTTLQASGGTRRESLIGTIGSYYHSIPMGSGAKLEPRASVYIQLPTLRGLRVPGLFRIQNPQCSRGLSVLSQYSIKDRC